MDCDGRMGPGRLSEGELLERFRLEFLSDPPRRFALCRVDGEARMVRVFGLGTDFEDFVVMCHSGGRDIARFSSAEAALRIFSRSRDLRLLWIDREEGGAGSCVTV